MIVSFLLTSTLVELTPGPNMTWLAVLGAARGRRAALSAVAGICIGLAVAGLVAGIGLTAVLTRFPVLFEILRVLGTLYLFYVAWSAWHEADGHRHAGQSSTAQAFRQGFVSNMFNPKAYLFYAAVLPQFLSGDMAIWFEVTLLTAIYVAVATTIHVGIALLSGSLAEFLQSSPKAILIRKALAVLIAMAACWFFYSTRVTQ